MKLKRFREGVWVDYPKAREVRLKIRPISLTESLNVLSEIEKKEVNDFGSLFWKMFDDILEAWKGIDPVLEGEEKPLTPMEIKKLIFDDSIMRDFIFQKAFELWSSSSPYS